MAVMVIVIVMVMATVTVMGAVGREETEDLGLYLMLRATRGGGMSGGRARRSILIFSKLP